MKKHKNIIAFLLISLIFFGSIFFLQKQLLLPYSFSWNLSFSDAGLTNFTPILLVQGGSSVVIEENDFYTYTLANATPNSQIFFDQVSQINGSVRTQNNLTFRTYTNHLGEYTISLNTTDTPGTHLFTAYTKDARGQINSNKSNTVAVHVVARGARSAYQPNLLVAGKNEHAIYERESYEFSISGSAPNSRIFYDQEKWVNGGVSYVSNIPLGVVTDNNGNYKITINTTDTVGTHKFVAYTKDTNGVVNSNKSNQVSVYVKSKQSSCGNNICEHGEYTSCSRDCDSVRKILDWSKFRQASFSDLSWEETSREILSSGVTRIQGNWTAGIFTTYNQNRNLEEIELKQRADIYLPPKIMQGKEYSALILAEHDKQLVLDKDETSEAVALRMGIPILRHGQYPVEWKAPFAEGHRGYLTYQQFNIMRDINDLNKPTDFITGNFVLALAKVNVLAASLLGEQLKSEGALLKDYALAGGSKEGYAAWITSAVDPRIKIVMAGRIQLQDPILSIEMQEANTGCPLEYQQPFNPNQSQENSCIGNVLPQWWTLKEQIEWKNWLKNTRSGQKWNQLFSPVMFQDKIYAKGAYLYGQTGMCGTHDSKFFSPGMESPFLDKLRRVDWRYDRWPYSYDDDEFSEDRLLLLANSLLKENGTLVSVPKIYYTVPYGIQSGAMTVAAMVNNNPTKVTLWWTHGNSRSFDGPNIPAWKSAEMTKVGTDRSTYWRTNSVQSIPFDTLNNKRRQMVAWYVEAERIIQINGKSVTLKDSSPIRFGNEYQKLTCQTN